MFRDELDILECRFLELDAVVDRFVIVEGDATHQGAKKESVFTQHQARFAHWQDRIVHVMAPLADLFDGNAWSTENRQREYIRSGLADAKPDDLVIVSDVDEIPTEESVRSLGERLHAIEVDTFRYVTF